jgi:hypothetical protein
MAKLQLRLFRRYDLRISFHDNDQGQDLDHRSKELIAEGSWVCGQPMNFSRSEIGFA